MEFYQRIYGLSWAPSTNSFGSARLSAAPSLVFLYAPPHLNLSPLTTPSSLSLSLSIIIKINMDKRIWGSVIYQNPMWGFKALFGTYSN